MAQSIYERLASGRGVRCAINQPSALQRYHKLHGKLCIAVGVKGGENKIVDVYFTKGKTQSMQIQTLALSMRE